jgi:predicted CxxxxCH...CXXCH cytochrome family protein
MEVSMTRALACLVVLVVAGCDLGAREAPLDEEAFGGPSEGCSGTCHGAGASIAPPRDTAGRSDLSSIGVGAHAAHLAPATWHKRFACETCHKIPAQVGDEGHIFVTTEAGQLRDALPAELTFGGLGDGTQWDHDTATCSSSYCHGDTLHQVDPATNAIIPSAGGTATKPRWTDLDGATRQCGACHGAPPPAPHPENPDCGLCHQSMNPGDFAANRFAYPELHINGVVEVASTQPCDSCHGSNGQAAPPRDAHQQTATTAPGVGAHAQHMTSASAWHAPIACNECHRVPGSTTDQTHLDSINQVDLDPTAQTGGRLQIAGAAYDPATLICSGTYCHGGGGSPLQDGLAMSPKWTRVDGTQSQCGSCHGNPPRAPHPQNPDCGTCHPTMTAGDPTRITYPAQHIDGNVDLIADRPCDTCHGSAGNPAPPRDTRDNLTTGSRGVGAHRSHVESSTWRAPISCDACHQVPTSTASLGHIDSPLPAELRFGAIAGPAASWSGTTCSNVYCHGGTLGAGGAATRPVWTVVNGSQSQCDSCHGAPPPAPHPVDSDCGKCHDTMTPGGGLVITDPARHIDGNVDVATDQACNACHGGTNNAPPRDTATPPNTATTARGVGAHQSHLAPATLYFKPIQCADCHRVPATVTSVGHIDTLLPAEIRFSARAGTSPAWNGAQCSSVYCHGSTLTSGATGAGGTATSPIWNKVDGTQSQCTSCHGFPPPPPHPQNSDCGTCHLDVVAGANRMFRDPSKHIDGNVDVDSNQACNACHGGANNAPPRDTATPANTSTTARGVGAHQAHLATSTWRAEIPCDTCHLVPGSPASVGHLDTPLPAELTFRGVAGGSVWSGSTCTSYCHGATLDGGTATNPLWTRVDGTQSQCTSCHGNPPPAPHPQNSACQACHIDAGPNGTIVDKALHIDGTVQITAGSNHPPGYAARDQHGHDFDLQGSSSCATAGCHGVALTGGSTGGPSCTGCHAQWQTSCTFCHGATGGSGAPPQGVFETDVAATSRHVGAHAKHVGATAMHAAWDCTYCHTKPTTALTPGHVDGRGATIQAEVVYSTLNPAGTYVAATSTCANLYCHGTGRTSAGTASWTSTSPLGCTSCHQVSGSGMSGEHRKHIADENMRCVDCHLTVVNAARDIIAPALHVNGVKEVKMPTGTFNPATKSCSGLGNGCHGTKSW